MQPIVRARQAAETALRAGTAFGRDRCSISAGGITYFALISIFPLALVALSVGGYILNEKSEQQDFINSIIDQVPLSEDGGRADLESIITSVADARGSLGIFGILGALYTGSALFTAVRLGLNGVFGGEKPRSFFLGKAIDIGLVLTFATLLTISIAATFVITFVVGAVDSIAPSDFEMVTRIGLIASYFILPPAISTVTFLLLYSIVPANPVPWRSALPGAIVATVAFELLKVGFSWYVASFGNYNATYGSLGFVIILLFFIYLSAQLMLFGAEVARATHEVRTGWPFAPGESQVDTITAKVRSMRAKLLRQSPPDAGEAAATTPSAARRPAPATGPAAIAASRPTPSPAQAAGISATTASPSIAGWMVTAVALAGIYVLAYLGLRRR